MLPFGVSDGSRQMTDQFAPQARNLAALALTGHSKDAQLPGHRQAIPNSVLKTQMRGIPGK
jgi:hypothetical protein